MPTIAGNLSVKTQAAHINPEAPGAPEVTKLERGGHVVQHNLIFASIWSKLFRSVQNRTVCTQNVCPKSIKMGVNGVPMAPHGLILGENEATPSRKLF